MKKTMIILLGVAMTAAVLVSAYAQFSKPEDAIKYRQAVMFLIGQHFGRMAAVVKGERPYAKEAFESNAVLVETFLKLPWEAFMVPGTDKGNTKLKPDAFKERDQFLEDGKMTEAAAAKLSALSKEGNFDAIKTQFGEVGKTCKTCHDSFRSR